MSLYQWIVVTFKGDTASVNYFFLIKAVPLLEILDTPLFCYINKLKCHVTRIVHGFGTNYLKKACPPTITYHPLPRTQTSLFRCARKGRQEGENGRDVASLAVCTLPMVPCGSLPVTRDWGRGCTTPSWKRNLHVAIAWENSRHLATPPSVSPRNDVRETSAEIPYWWRVTTQIWVVLLIGWNKFPTKHDKSEALPRSG